MNTTFELIQLPYAPNALEPVISAETIGFHHGKHLQSYVTNLNGLLPGTPFEGKALEDIVRLSMSDEQRNVPVANNAGQLLNHNLYFTQFTAPSDDKAPVGTLAAAIDEQFGSFAAFKAAFEQKGTSLFGSGWVWLAADKDGKLQITQEPNAGNPVARGLKPLLTFDVWEHAYYLDYQNRRPAHLAALWQIIDWNVIERRYTE